MTETTFLQAEPGGISERLARRSRSRRPLVSGAAVAAAGYVIMTAILVLFGLLLTRLLLDGSVGRWDSSVERWFFEHRTPTFDGLTRWGSLLGDTFTVIGIATVAVILLAIKRLWAHVAFLVAALVIEVTTFLTTTFLVDRPRPTVPHLDAGPPTSSFPSGHTAAAIVLYVGLALIVTSLVRNAIVRGLVWVLAVSLPIVVGLSRLYRGMHHPTDVIASVLGAAGCLAFALLATRTGVAVGELDERPDAAPSSPPAAPIVVPREAPEVSR